VWAGTYLGKSNENAEEERCITSTSTKGRNERHLRVIDILRPACLDEVDVGDENGDPGQQTKDSDEIDKVSENHLRVIRNVHVGQQTERGREEERVDGHTTGVGAGQYPRCFTGRSQAIDGTRSDVQIRVRSGEDEEKDTAVDETR